VFVVLPLVVCFAQAFPRGSAAYFAALSDPEALSAIRLTLLVAAISSVLNLVFGLIAAWAMPSSSFPARHLDLADRPAVSVSPVISRVLFSFCCSARRAIWVRGSRATTSGVVCDARHRVADTLRDVSFVARGMIPYAEQGTQEEEAAISLGAQACRPSSASRCPTSNGACCMACCYATPARWASSARCSVVSGQHRGETNHDAVLVEIL